MSEQLFSDLLVIDCASFVAGPAAATILADFGARVIKVESLDGDGYRLLSQLRGLPKGESNYPWNLTNRNKESLALDLKQDEGRALLDKLIAKADVFITNLPFPARRRLQLDYEAVQKANPSIIYASLTAYGEQGPEADSTGYDATAWWARSGLMDMVRANEEALPAISVPAMGDHMAANSLYGSIVTALYQRERTGKGAQVGSSLMGNGLWSNGVYVQAALEGADMSQRMDVTRISAFTNSYRCRDDRWLMLAVLLQAQDAVWPDFTRCLHREELLEDERFSTLELREKNKQALRQVFEEAFAEQDWEYWKERCAKFHITCGSISRPLDLCDDEQAAAAGMLVEYGDGSGDRTVDSPLFVEGADKQAPRPAPAVGEHSLAILRELGVDESSVEKLKTAGVVGA